MAYQLNCLLELVSVVLAKSKISIDLQLCSLFHFLNYLLLFSDKCSENKFSISRTTKPGFKTLKFLCPVKCGSSALLTLGHLSLFCKPTNMEKVCNSNIWSFGTLHLKTLFPDVSKLLKANWSISCFCCIVLQRQKGFVNEQTITLQFMVLHLQAYNDSVYHTFLLKNIFKISFVVWPWDVFVAHYMSFQCCISNIILSS